MTPPAGAESPSGGTPVTARSARTVAWSIGLASVVLMTVGLVFRFVNRSATLPLGSDAWSVGGVFNVVANLTLPFFGIVIVSRRRENPIGWLFLVAGFTLAFTSFARSYALHALVADPGSLPGGHALAWLATWIEPIAIAMLPWLFLLFPTGRLPSPRWRPLARVLTALLVLGPASFLVLATETWNRPFVDFETVSGGTVLDTARVMVLGSVLAFVLATLASAAAVIVRFRRAVGEERLQLKWFVSTAALVAVAFCVAIFVDTAATGLFFTFTLVLLDAAIAIAMLKHRLYDIDVIIGKTVVYGVLGAFITVVYVLVVVVVGAFIGATEGLAIVATAIVAVAAQPVREKARRAANRLVYGKRATPYEVLSEFSESVAGTYAGEEIMPRMARLLAEGTGATAAKVWLRVDSEIRPTAVWPPDAGLGSARRLVNHELPDFADVAAAVPVRHGGELLGALSVATPLTVALQP